MSKSILQVLTPSLVFGDAVPTNGAEVFLGNVDIATNEVVTMTITVNTAASASDETIILDASPAGYVRAGAVMNKDGVTIVTTSAADVSTGTSVPCEALSGPITTGDVDSPLYELFPYPGVTSVELGGDTTTVESKTLADGSRDANIPVSVSMNTEIPGIVLQSDVSFTRVVLPRMTNNIGQEVFMFTRHPYSTTRTLDCAAYGFLSATATSGVDDILRQNITFTGNRIYNQLPVWDDMSAGDQAQYNALLTLAGFPNYS